MSNLITIGDFEGIKKVNLNQDQARQLDPLITEAQEMDAKNLLGDAFYEDIITNPTSTTNKVLLDGGQYDNNDGDLVSFRGLKVMLVYFTFSRYIGTKNVQDTPFGFVNKAGEKSKQISSSDITRENKASRAAAFAVWGDIEVFLRANVNRDKYPLFECHTRASHRSSATITRTRGDGQHHGHHRDHDDHHRHIGRDHNIII